MSKYKSKVECKAIANELFESQEKEDRIIVTEDGQAFFGKNESAARNHAKYNPSGKKIKMYEFERSDECTSDSTDANVGTDLTKDVKKEGAEGSSDAGKVETDKSTSKGSTSEDNSVKKHWRSVVKEIDACEDLELLKVYATDEINAVKKAATARIEALGTAV